jgi:hypothetical protein
LTSALVIGVTLLTLNDSATVYSKKDLPTTTIDVSQLPQKEKPGGSYAQEDTNDYHVLQARVGQYSGIEEGKYLVNADGRICYLVDPGINGRLDRRDDGTEVKKFVAPKAALMSFIVDGVLTRKLPWDLVLLGVAISLVLELAGVPALPFAVGIYLPLSASMPIFAGGMTRWLCDRFARRTAAEAEMSPGVLLSSGYIAGGTICGIIVAFIALKEDWAKKLAIGPGAMVDLMHRIGWPGFSPEWVYSAGFTLIPFGALVAVLLLIGSRRS